MTRPKPITQTGDMLDRLHTYAIGSDGNKIVSYKDRSLSTPKVVKDRRIAKALEDLARLLSYQASVIADDSLDHKTKREILDGIAKKYRVLAYHYNLGE